MTTENAAQGRAGLKGTLSRNTSSKITRTHVLSTFKTQHEAIDWAKTSIRPYSEQGVSTVSMTMRPGSLFSFEKHPLALSIITWVRCSALRVKKDVVAAW